MQYKTLQNNKSQKVNSLLGLKNTLLSLVDVKRFGKFWTGFTEEIYVYKNNDLFTHYKVENILSRSFKQIYVKNSNLTGRIHNESFVDKTAF